MEAHTDIGTVTNTADSLIELGLSSLKMMKFVYVLRKEGVHVTFADLIADPSIDAWARLAGVQDEPELPKPAPQSVIERKDTFPMTDLQYAYWVGSDPHEPLGGVSCHAYMELDGSGIDCDRL